MRTWLRPRRIIPLAVAVAVASAVAAGLLLASPDPTAPDTSNPVSASARPNAPEIEGEVLVPPPVRLANLRGKPVLVNFWASWCVACREEAPDLARFDREMRERAQLVGVDFQDAKGDALAYVREFGWRFPNVRDPNGKLAGRYGLVGLPTTYLVDRQGRIVRALTGAQTFGSLAKALEEVE